MAVMNFDELTEHIGHKIEVVSYGDEQAIENVAIECEECSEILLDYDRESEDEENRAITLTQQEADYLVDLLVDNKDMLEDRDFSKNDIDQVKPQIKLAGNLIDKITGVL